MVSFYYKKNKIGLKVFSMNCQLGCRTKRALHSADWRSGKYKQTQRVAGKNKQEKQAIKANKESCCKLNKAFMILSFCFRQTVHFVSVLQ